MPTVKYSQGYNDRLDDSLSMKDGKESTKSQSYKSRRDESKAMSKKLYKHAYGGDHSMVRSSHSVTGSVKDHITRMVKK
tara:strand:- start:409 stop:645 length:237 start_codon:yes stop_codon:yes gene_type:complete